MTERVNIGIPADPLHIPGDDVVAPAILTWLRKICQRDFIEIDITPLKIGSKLYIHELRNDDYKLLHPDNTVVCQVRRSRLAVVDEEEEEEGTAEEGATADATATEAPATEAQE